MQSKDSVLVITGEESGEIYGAGIVSAIKSLNPSIEVYGIGGKRMREAGCILIEEIKNLGVVGILEIVHSLPVIVKTLKKVKNFIKEKKPVSVILVDYPDFNFQVAKFAKTQKVKVLYFISPQIWAWRRGRIKFVKKNIDKMFVIFPFEVDFYREHDIDVEFVGHPIAKKVKSYIENHGSPRKDTNLVGLLPGSRKREIRVHFPVILKAAEMLKKRFRDLKFLIATPKNMEKEVISEMAKTLPEYVNIVEGDSFRVMHSSKFLISTSGTATLESALFGKPVIIIYKVNPLSYILGRLLIKVPYIGMPNLLLGEKLNPELIQYRCNEFDIFFEAAKFIRDTSRYEKVSLKNSSLLKTLLKEEDMYLKVAQASVG